MGARHGQKLGDLLVRREDESFVGREEELAVLLALLEEEEPLVVHVHGIAGVGKSALDGAVCRVAFYCIADAAEISAGVKRGDPIVAAASSSAAFGLDLPQSAA